MKKFKILSFLFFINMILLNIAISQENQFVMPKGFENIKMDMPLSEFVSIRKNVEPFSFGINYSKDRKIDLGKKDQMILEMKLENSLFTNAMYEFKNSRLKALIILGKWDILEFYNKRNELITFLYKNYGAEFYKKAVNLGADRGKYNSPLLLWDKNSVKIAMTCIPGNNLNLIKGTLQLNIFVQDNLDISSYFQEIKDYTEINKLFNEIGVFTVLADSTEVRDGNDDNSSIIGNVNKGEVVIMVDSNNGWSKVIYSSGDEGWINDTFLE